MDGGVRDQVRYVCMPGSPYTGSTLLGFLLNSHPDCVSIGAATGLTRHVEVDTYQCSCGEPFLECDFWLEVRSRTERLGHPVTVFRSNFWNTHVRISERRWLNGLLIRSLGNDRLTDARDRLVGGWSPIASSLQEARSSTWALASSVLEMTGTSVFVDTARDHQRPKYLRDHPGLDLRVIHLVRDPRGAVASIMGHTGVDVRRAARQWTHYNDEAHRVRRHVARDAWMRLRYEDLCAEPQRVMDEIARFVGVEPAPLPDNLDGTTNHIIGNAMRLTGVGEIRLDEKWRQRLDTADLDVIADITADTSHRLGYDWP